MPPSRPSIVTALVARKKYIYLCTNALLLKEKIDLFTPSKYLTFSVHMDGQEEHDVVWDAAAPAGTMPDATALAKYAQELLTKNYPTDGPGAVTSTPRIPANWKPNGIATTTISTRSASRRVPPTVTSHEIAVPPHTPAPLQVSPELHAFASLHATVGGG